MSNIQHSTFNVEMRMMEGHALSWPLMLMSERLGEWAGEFRIQGMLKRREILRSLHSLRMTGVVGIGREETCHSEGAE